MVRVAMFSILFKLLFALSFIHTLIAWWDIGRLRGQVRNVPQELPSGMYACNENGGKMCSKNLEGYYMCKDWDLDKKNIHICPTSTRCGCTLEENLCELENICIPIKTPYPMTLKATFYFNGSYTDNYYGDYPRDFKERKYLWGVVKQDVEKKKYLQVITLEDDYPGDNFELIVPDGNGRIVKYSGRKGKRCDMKIIPAFEPFGHDIKHYHLIGSKSLGGQKSQQTWRMKAQHETIIFHDMSWKWVIQSDASTRSAKPIKTYFYINGLDSDHHGTYSKTQVARWSTHPLDAPWGSGINWYIGGRDDNDWFKIPDICKQ